MSESRLTSYYAVAKRFVPREHYFKSSRRVIGSFGNYGIASWSGTAFEYFMPTLLLPSVKRSLSDFALSFAYRVQKKHAVKRVVLGKRRAIFGVSESGYFAFDGEMNYQYHAFGTERLSLDPMVRAEEVIAPYASFLMLEVAPERVTENLGELEALGMYGKYGFYEAIDFTPSRCDGSCYRIVKAFTSHHLGISLCALDNLAFDGALTRRFTRNPRMMGAEDLLWD
jgi:cyclic beta-1,2-glucan synthetase